MLAVAYATDKEKLTFLEEDDKVKHQDGHRGSIHYYLWNTHTQPILQILLICPFVPGFVCQVEESVIWGASRTPWTAGPWKRKVVRPGLSDKCSSVFLSWQIVAFRWDPHTPKSVLFRKSKNSIFLVLRSCTALHHQHNTSPKSCQIAKRIMIDDFLLHCSFQSCWAMYDAAGSLKVRMRWSDKTSHSVRDLLSSYFQHTIV